MSSNPTHEQIVEVKRREPAASEQHLVRVVVDMADIARRYGPRAAAQFSGTCRFLEGAVRIEKVQRIEPPPHESFDAREAM